MRILRVFPRRTSFTPKDSYAFVGDPPMIRPEADEVHISCSFTWDKKKAEYLQQAWAQYYPVVKVGGPAFDAYPDNYIAGMYVKNGVTFTSWGCGGQCPWCLVHIREGGLRLNENFPLGNIVQDNNFLQCPKYHKDKVYQMLRKQKRIEFSGGLSAGLLSWEDAEQMRSLNIYQLFFACDTKGALVHLKNSGALLKGIVRRKLRCYVLLAFNGQTIDQAIDHLENVWAAGFMPHAQLYQPSDRLINYSPDWRNLARRWSRPAIMQTMHKARL
jgi:hypothetical protein